MEPLYKFEFEAVNIYFSAVCNLRCRYCFQPKINGISQEINKKIVNWITSGKMEEDIIKYYGVNISALSLWGGEPGINLPILEERLEFIYNKFPKLETIHYSSNISTKKLARNSVNFIKKIAFLNEKLGKKISVSLQFSIDGPPEINDYNRVGSKAENILNNITFLLEELKDVSPDSYSLNIKGTQSADNITFLIKDNNLLEYYQYFDKWQSLWLKILPEEKIPKGSTFITLVYPGNFTQEDGFNFKKLIELQNSESFQEECACNTFVNFDNQVTRRIKDTLSALRAGYYREYKGELLRVCSCSAGKSCGGLTYDSQFHLCQATYMFNEDILNYIEKHNLISEFEDKQGFSFRSFDDLIKDNIVVSFSDDLKLSRLLYKINNFNYNLSLKVQYFEVILSELAAANQISRCYLDPKWRDLGVAYLLFGGHECPVNNIWEFSSPYIRSTSHLKLVFNGAFEYYVSNHYRDILGLNIKDMIR